MTSGDNTTYQGRVKWFNSKSGYGFITIIGYKKMDETIETDGSVSMNDIFAHQSAICVSVEQYKYLVEGEYVEFSLSNMNSDESRHEFQASSIRGINGGKLLCETRNENRLSALENRNGASLNETNSSAHISRSIKYRGNRRGQTTS
jgi:cold shock CspA family protein